MTEAVDRNLARTRIERRHRSSRSQPPSHMDSRYPDALTNLIYGTVTGQFRAGGAALRDLYPVRFLVLSLVQPATRT